MARALAADPQVLLMDEPFGELDPVTRGALQQEMTRIHRFLVAQNIATVPQLQKWSRARIDDRIDELMALLGLEPNLRERYPHQLSGGKQQRVGLARALAADPQVILMDEPFGALDPVTRGALQQEMTRIHRLQGRTIVLVTHDIDEALRLAEHARGCEVLPVVNTQGQPFGTMHFQDLLEEA